MMQKMATPSYDLEIVGTNCLVEPMSRRIKVYEVPPKKMMNRFVSQLRKTGKDIQCDKLIFYVKNENKEWMYSFPCSYEGKIESFFNGEDALIYAMFLHPERNLPQLLPEEREVMRVLKTKKEYTGYLCIPEGYQMRWAKERDTTQMAQLYSTVFKSYPTPMNNPDFIKQMMKSDVYFLVVEKEGEIVSACSADVLFKYNAAELSDCATLKEHRTKQLLTYQVAHLIPLLKRMGVQTLFSYSRSVSIGMNLVNKKHGFTYGGRMIQNSNIAGSMENMNIWYKKL